MSLKDDRMKYLRAKYPNVPEHALPDKKFTDKTANGLTVMILTHCKMNKIFARRISSEGRYRPGDSVVDAVGHKRELKGMWLPGLNVGLPDVFLIIKGKFVGIEVKAGKDRQSAAQKETQADIQAAGGKYYIVKTFDEFLCIIS